MGIEENVVPGKILYLNVSFPHQTEYQDKYLLVVASGDYPLFLKINTEGVQSEIAKKNKERQFRIKKSNYPFLDHDRYIDCGTVWSNLLNMEDIVKQMTEDPRRIMGEIQESHKNEVINLTSISRSIDKRYKRIIAEGMRKK